METVKLGSRGADVELLQLALSRVGYYFGNIDGIFGAGTQTAVLNFQRNFGLTPDGIVGVQTWNRLLPYIRGYFVKTVQQGDTFWSLANQYGTSVRAITTANPNVNPDNLQPGQRLVIPFSFPVVPTNITYTSHLTSFVMEGLRVRYPFIRQQSIGRSVMGKNILALSIGTGFKEVCYNATHHANEWITTPVLLKYLEDYASAYARGGSVDAGGGNRVPASFLYSKVTLYVVPLVNPDGLDLVAGVLNSGPYYTNARSYAANYPSIPFPSGWKANINGIDLNLQYPAQWEQARQIKFAQGFTSPAPRDYVGEAPLEAPESRAMYQFTLSRNFSLILAYHTQGKVIFWRFADYMPPNAAEIVEKMSAVSGYAALETPAGSAYAGYKDWFIQNYNRPGYTIEAGLGNNPLPISQFDEIYRDNVGILTLGMTEV